MKQFIALSAAMLAALQMGAVSTGTITVDTGTKRTDIQKSMYGIFFEEINHSGDGGLYGEMIQNRGFDEQRIPGGCTYENGRIYAPQGVPSWNDQTPHNWWANWDIDRLKYTAWSVQNSDCEVKHDVVEIQNPLNDARPCAFTMTISDSKASAKAQLVNEGYWGFAVEQGKAYKVRLYVRTSDYTGKMGAMACDSKGNSLGSLSFDVDNSGEWKEYTGRFTASSTVNDGTFRLEFSGNGTIDVCYVSVFPEDTFRGRDNGLRKDVAEALEALHPDFIRWPGGCIVEGITMGNRVKWKETIGDPVTRPGEYDCWGYRCTWGAGYHDMLLFAEDINMDFMFVGNLGMGCMGRNADFVTTKEDLQPYIDEIRDAIEYAIGDPATNEWAAKRAEAGHPEPFSLKYVELGNENYGVHYTKLFNMAYEELKAEYPDLVFINTLAHYDGDLWRTPKNDMVDSHYYKEPDWFYNTSTFDYDIVDRDKIDYKIYVGEYACNEQVGSGNLDAALSECVYMNNMERNSDIVTMTSYAPLISNQNRPDWACNLIWVNNHQTVGRASYWAQVLYSENRPDFNVRSRVSKVGKSSYSGRIALGTFATKASFRNVKCTSPVDGRVLYEDDLSVENGDWFNAARGEWAYEDGVLKQKNLDQSTYFVMDRLSFNDVVFEVEAMKTGGNEGFLINFGVNDEDINHSWRFNIGGWGNTSTNLEEADGYWGPTVATQVPMRLENDRWYRIKMVGQDGVIRCYIDDELIEEYRPNASNEDITPGRLNMAAGYDKANGELVLKVVNAYGEPYTSQVTLNAANISATGQVITLGADKLYWENSFNDPQLIVPQYDTYDGFAENFEYTFPAYTLTIFRVKADLASEAIQFPQASYTDVPTELNHKNLSAEEAAVARLVRLIARAEYSAREGLPGYEEVQMGILKAKHILASEPNEAAAIDSWTDLCEKLETYFQANMVPENECTSAIENASYENRSSLGWHGSSITLNENVAEYYNGTFGIYQNVENLEPGTYLLTVQAFYRCGFNPWQDKAWDNLHAMLYGNDQSVNIRGLYSNDTFEWNMAGANELFNRSETTSLNYLVCEVAQDGVLTIELSKENVVEGDWVCWNNFRLFFLTDETLGVEGTLIDTSNEVYDTNVYDLAGRYVGKVQNLRSMAPGIYINSGRKILVK